MNRARLIAALVLGALAAPLFAQALVIPPTRELIDDNNVDLLRGTYVVDETMASLGGNQGLSYRRINRGQSFFTDNFKAVLANDVSTYYATFDGRTDRFTKSGSTYTPTEANGSSLTFNATTNIYTYTARDGTVITFDRSISVSLDPAALQGTATSIVSPNGNRLDFVYQRTIYCAAYDENEQRCLSRVGVRRLVSVRNAYGYIYNIGYLNNDAPYDSDTAGEWQTVVSRKLINRAVDYCDPNAPGCVTTQTWPGPDNPNLLVNSYVTGADGVTGVRRPGSATNDITIAYTSGKVASVADFAGATTYAFADAGGSRTVTVTNSLSEVSTYVFNLASERLTSFTDPLNNTTNYTYDGNARLTRITKPEGNYTNYTYDSRGNVTEARNVAKPGSGLADIVATAAFPATCTNIVTCNQPTSTTDARGKVTDYTYSTTHGGVLTVTAPAPTTGAVRPKQTFTYVTQQAQIKSSTGAIVGTGTNITLPQKVSQCATLASCANGADEVRSVVTYGANGVANNLLPTQVASGNGTGTLTATTKFAYDMIGNLVTVDGPLTGTDDTTTAIYDDKRRAIGTVSPDPDGAGGRPRLASRNSFATNGDLTKVEIGTATGTTLADLNAMTVAQASDMAYDADGRKVSDTLAGGGSAFALSQYSYDSEHRLTCAAARMNPAAWGSLPASACALGAAGGFGPDRITKTIRDANGRPTQIQVAIGTAEPANERTLGYNNNGTLAHLIDANDNRTTYEYDGHDRLVKTRLPLPAIGSNSSSTTDYEQLTLDAGGNVTSRRLRDGQSIAFTFDALNRVTLKDLPGSEPDVSYGYDLLNRMTSASQGGNNLAFTFDALNRKLTEAGPLGAATSTYDLAGRRTTLALPGGGITITYDRDVIGGVTAIRENGATSGVGILATYQYDSLGRRSSVTRGNGTSTNYSFDAASRLSSLTQDLASTANDLTIGPLAYNPASQITALTRSNDLYAWTGHSNQNIASVPNGLNQLTSIGGVATTHDGRGNLTGDPTSGKTYGYSSENMLTSATGGVTLAYDPFLRMSQVAGAATTRFGYDGIDLVAEGDGTNAILRRYVPGPGVDEPVVWYEGTGTADRRWLHADERGSVLAVSNASGNSIITNRYDEYGTPQSTNSGRFQYTGQKWIGEIGAYDYRARIYSPFVGGRFLQTDPIGFTGGINLYAYVRNDPVNLTDPSGLDDETIIVTHPRNPKCEGICYGPPSDIAIAGPSLFWLPHFEDVGGAVERSRNEKQQCTQYDEFFEDNFTPALGVAMQYSTNVFNLLGLAALESDWGRSPMSRNLNNPFGATPGGFSTPGVPYGSFVSAWQNWGQQWGVRVAGTGNNANAFVSNLGMNNQGTTGRVDTRGPYNTQNARTGGDPKWGQKVKDTIKSAKKRGADWNPACSEGGN